jgi:hypothetical protein
MRMFRILRILFLISLLSSSPVKLTTAETMTEGWTPPILLFSGEGEIHTPVVLADKTEKVHVFWIYQSTLFDPDGNQIFQIFYTQGEDDQWSVPVDVIAVTSINNLSATIDNDGIIHLAWSGGNHYYYIRSSTNPSTEVRSWSKPEQIAVGNATGNLYADPTGRIYLAYPGLGTSGVFYISSDNNGLDWSTPRKVINTQGERSSAAYPFLIVGKNDMFHFVWTEFQLPQGWPPTGIYYTQSSDGGTTWSYTSRVAGEGYDQINIAVGDNGLVHLVWNAMVGVYGRYHSWSLDNGSIWSTPEIIMTQGATSGPPQLVIDNSGALHLLTTNDGAWYDKWNGGGWDSWVNVSEEETRVTLWIEEAVMAGSSNKLHAVFWADRKRLWYTSKVIPGLLDKKESKQTETFSADQNQGVFPVPTKVLPTVESGTCAVDHNLKNLGTGYFILVGAISPVIMVLVVMLIRRIRR